MRTAYKNLLLPLCLLGSSWVHAAEFIVQDVRVEGLQRISAGTVFNYLPVTVGSTVRSEDYPEIIRALFKTGLFSDVNLERDGNVLVVRVTERPAIAELKITGNRDISTDDLKKSLKEVGLAEGRVFDRSLLEKVEQELLNQYYSRGKYAVRIGSEVKELPGNRVAVNLDISEGVAARIRQINFVGNQAFSDDELLDEMQLSTGGWLSWLTKDDQYSKQKLAADLEALRSFYLDQGYLKFSVDSTQVSITPDKQDIYVTINVTEGERYTIKDVKLSGNLIVPEDELKAFVTLKQGDAFSRKQVTEISRKIGERLGDEGYAFANINAVPQVDEANKTVSLNFVVDPGRRVYVRRINFAGNQRTQDEVLRREMRQTEGAWFSSRDVNRSKTRVQRLPYIEDVNVETPAVAGTTDQVDVNFNVTERRSGSVVFGVGYGQESGVLLNAQFNESNFLGTGKQLGLAFNNSSVNTIYSITYNNPYFTDEGLSAGFRLAYQETDVGESNAADYLTDRGVAELNFGLPITETDTVRLSAGLETLKIKTNADNTPQEIFDYLAQNGDDYLFYKVEGSWVRDSRNRTVFADRGMLNRIIAEVALPGSDETYYKLNYRHQSFWPVTDDLTLALRGDVGYGEGYGDTEVLPFYENYFAGGLRTVRGYKANTLGPRYSNGESAGGALRTVGGADVYFPVPFGGKELRNVRMAAFFDIGNVFETTSDFDAGELRYSLGLSAEWLSPLGPLVLSVAQPLNKKDGDEDEPFQFSFGIPY
ncbi:MAG TPA: outer membrane protein assembly factor BamA [Candidatus Competibacteraceae bacterium]|nr:outer membrane protein assembly factor BamA [Candidatus Competibacteraceae bacterium]